MNVHNTTANKIFSSGEYSINNIIFVEGADSPLLRTTISTNRGVKSFLWPFMLILQIIKMILIAIFLPSVLGSIGNVVIKGSAQLGNNPTEIWREPLPPYTISDTRNISQSNTAQEELKISAADKRDSYKFQNVPNSTFMLSGYDPFYSPILSRLDTVFRQLSLDEKQELCREKLVCLMYQNPAKYAPYSNLVAAQLSRELDELKKPNNNPEILRFFKYMKAAKEGQNGNNCNMKHHDCLTITDATVSAMLLTFNDINRLVQARKEA